MAQSSNSPASDSPAWLALVRRKVEQLQFGVVQIVVHNSRVVQVETTEKTRFETNPAPQATEKAA